MSEAYPLVPLGDFLTPVSRPERVDPEKTYHVLGAHWYAEGLYTKDIKTGATIQADKVYRVERGDFVYNRLFAWKGSFAIATAENHGCYVSNEFPCFIVKPERAIGQYLWRYFSIESAWDEAFGHSTGGTPTSRNRLKEEKLLAMRLPLPPVAEQRRVVARIEELADKIAEARGLRRQAEGLSSRLYEQSRDGLYRQLPCERQPIAETFDLINGRAFKPDEWGESGRKIVRIQNLKYSTASYNRFDGPVQNHHIVRANDVLFAWSGQVVSIGAHIWHGDDAVLNQHIFNVKPRLKMLPRFVQEGFNALVDEMKSQVRGLEMFHIRKQEINRLVFPVPPLSEQQRIVDYLDNVQAKMDALKRLQAETAVELDALLPSVLDRAFRGAL